MKFRMKCTNLNYIHLTNVYTWATKSPLKIQSCYQSQNFPCTFCQSIPTFISTSTLRQILLKFFHHRLVLLVLYININKFIQYVFFCVRLLSLCIIIFWSLIYSEFVPFYWWILFYYKNIPQCVYLFSHWWTSRLFPVWK